MPVVVVPVIRPLLITQLKCFIHLLLYASQPKHPVTSDYRINDPSMFRGATKEKRKELIDSAEI